MADFKTHMTVSTATGALLAFAGYKVMLPWETCVVAGTLCSVSGMLPDLDSNSGRPLREATALGAAVIPMLMVERLQKLDLRPDQMVLIAIATYFSIRFVLAEIFRRYTVHRGMWHSLPAAAICGMVAFLVMSHEDMTVRVFKTSGVVLGFLSHLILDEIWSIDFKKGSYKFKESFGTALKLWGRDMTANAVTYIKLLVIGVLVWQDQGFMSKYHQNPDVPHTASEMFATIRDRLRSAGASVRELRDRLPGNQDFQENALQGNQDFQGNAIGNTDSKAAFGDQSTAGGFPASTVPVPQVPSGNATPNSNAFPSPTLPGWK